jgi:hypothetical protein
MASGRIPEAIESAARGELAILLRSFGNANTFGKSN